MIEKEARWCSFSYLDGGENVSRKDRLHFKVRLHLELCSSVHAFAILHAFLHFGFPFKLQLRH